MQRRQVLRAAGLAAGSGALGLAGCLAAPASTAAMGCPGEAPPPASAGSPPEPPGGGDVDLPVPRSDPAFGPDWAGVEPTGLNEDPSLTDEDLVVGVARDGQARAYPLATLSTYEVVNDDLGGPLLVTYCPLCASAVVAERTVGGEPTVFGVSGLLYRSNLVMYDRRTDSLWSQLLARAIRGPETGTTFEQVPSTLATWADWRATHPGTDVLLPPPHSGTIASVPTGNPAGVHGHVGVQDVGLDFSDDRLPRTALVLGVATEDAARAYPAERVAEAGAINDCVGGVPVVVAGDRLPYAYDRRIEGLPRRFERAGAGRLRAAGTTWAIPAGEGIAGRHAGKRLRPAPGTLRLYWFAWLDLRSDTSVYPA